MDINKLVESITKPFLEDIKYMEPLDSIATDNKDNYPLGDKKASIEECSREIKSLLGKSSIKPIRELASMVNESMMAMYLQDRPEILKMMTDQLSQGNEDNVDASWENRNDDMADKLGYDVVDWIGNEKKVDISLDDEEEFMDISGVVCEEFSIRQKVRESLKKKYLNETLCRFFRTRGDTIRKLIKESNTNGLIDGGTREIAPFASFRGYTHFLEDKVAVTSGYNIDEKWVLEKKYVAANEDGGSENGSFTILEDQLQRTLNTYNDITRLYLEFITQSKSQDDEIAHDGSEYDIKSGDVGKISHKKHHDGTPKMSDQTQQPKPGQPGFGGTTKSSKIKPTNKKALKNTPKNNLINT